MTDTYVTSATQYIDAEGIRYAYRRFGCETGVPLILFQNFRQGMDNVDPLLLNGFARDRPVILFDNAGVASSSGETPDTIEAMADQAAAFVGALKLTELDVLGFSIGGYSAQAFVLRHPHLVHRLMLVGTAPRAQEPRTDPHVDQVVSRPVLGLEEHLFLLFTPSVPRRRSGLLGSTTSRLGTSASARVGYRPSDLAADRKGSIRGNPRVAPGQMRAFRGAQDDQAAHARRKRLQRYHGPDHQLVDLGSEHSGCAAHRLSGFRTRGAFSVSGAISAAQQTFFGRIGSTSGHPYS